MKLKCSLEFKSVLKQMLNIDPEERPNASDLISHVRYLSSKKVTPQTQSMPYEEAEPEIKRKKTTSQGRISNPNLSCENHAIPIRQSNTLQARLKPRFSPA